MADLSPEIEKLAEKVQKDPTSRLFFPLAEEYVKSGLLDEAAQVLIDGLARHPNFLSARVTLGKVYFEQGKLNEARSTLEEVFKAAPDNLLATRKLAAIYLRDGRLELARQYCETLLTANPKDAEMQQLLQHIQLAAAGPEPDPVDRSSVDPTTTEMKPVEDAQGLMGLSAASSSIAEVELPGQTASEGGQPSEPSTLLDDPPAEMAQPTPARPLPAAQEVQESASASEEAAEEELISPTLAQLYLRQGHYERAVHIYDELLRSEPENETLKQARRMAFTLMQGENGSSADAPAGLLESAADLPSAGAPVTSSHDRIMNRLGEWLSKIERRRRAS